MTATRVPRHERREQLLDVALELIAQDGVHSLSMQAIAGRAGVGKPVLYRIFPSMSELLVALIEREDERIDTALKALFPAGRGQRHPRELLLDGIRQAIQEIEAAPLIWRLALYPPQDVPDPLRHVVDRRRAEVLKRTRQLVREAAPELEIDGPIDDEIYARTLIAASQEYWRLLLSHPELDAGRLERSVEQLVAMMPWRLIADDGATVR